MFGGESLSPMNNDECSQTCHCCDRPPASQVPSASTYETQKLLSINPLTSLITSQIIGEVRDGEFDFSGEFDFAFKGQV